MIVSCYDYSIAYHSMQQGNKKAPVWGLSRGGGGSLAGAPFIHGDGERVFLVAIHTLTHEGLCLR